MLRQDNRPLADDNEAEIQKGIAQLREQIETALAGVDDRGTRATARSLEELRELARELRSIRDRRTATGPNRENAGADSNRGSTSGGGNRGGQAGGAFDGHGGGLVQPGELEDIAARARRVTADLVEENRLQPGDIDPLLASLETLALDPESADPAAHDLALRALMELEFRLRNELDARELPDLLVSDPGKMPDEYRDMIADYFRNLSRD